MSSQTPGENPPRFPPGFDFTQIPPRVQQGYIQNVQEKISSSNTGNHPRPATRGRGRGRGRGGGRKPRKDMSSSDSSSFSGDDDGDSPVFQATAIDSGRRRSTRTRTRSHSTNYQVDESDNNENQNQQETQEQNKQEGPQIDRIIGQISDSSQPPRFICKMPDKSLIHSLLFTENDLKSSTQASHDLTYFKTRIEKTGSVVSELGSNIIQSSNETTTASNFCIERIIGHKQIGQEDISNIELIDKGIYTPGYPTPGLPNLDDILVYEAPLQSPPDDIQNSFLEETGVISFHGLFGSSSQSKDIDSEEDDQQIEQQRPKQILYYVKWRGLGENLASWETPECLQGSSDEKELFKIGNLDEIPHLIDIYWQNTLEKKRITTIPLSTFNMDQFPLMDRNIPLSDSQKQIVNQLIQYRIDNKPEINLQNSGTGRIGAIVSFLQIMKRNFNHRCKTVIISDKDKIEKWKTALEMLTSLYFAEYSFDVGSRSIVRQWEVLTTNQDKSPKLDVLIMEYDTYLKEYETLQQVKWNYVIVDSLTPPRVDISRFPSISFNSEGGVFRIFIGNRINAVPDFTYKEEVLFVHNDIAQVLRDRLAKQLKMKNTRSTVLTNPYPLYAEMVYCHNHPFLISTMDNLITTRYKARLNIQHLSMNQRLDLFASSSGKISKLISLIQHNPRSVVVFENISMIRLVQTYLFQLHIPEFVINSPLKQEQYPQNPNGIILMTRDCTSPALIPLVVDQVIFYDIGRYQDSDISLVRFFKRNNPNLTVLRLITSSSLETVLYSRYILEEAFDYFNPDCAADYLRVEAFTTTPGFDLADYTHQRTQQATQPTDEITPQQMQLNQTKVDPITEMVCTFPGDDKLAEMTQPLFEECAMDPDFWDKVFAHSRFSHIKAIEWKKSEGIKLVEFLCENGFDNFATIAKELGKTEDDVYIFCRAVLVRILADLNRFELANNNLVHAILWFEFNNGGFDQYEDIFDLWQQIATDEPTLSISLFTKKPFLNRISVAKDTILPLITRQWIIQTYLHIRKHPYLPNRFIGITHSYQESSQILFSLLNSYLSNGQSLLKIQPDFPLFKSMDAKSFEKFFNHIIEVIHRDILALAFHSISDGTYQQFSNDKYMKPFILSCLKGPFSDSWSDTDIQKLIQVAMEYYIPTKRTPTGDIEDFSEFQALTNITSKSTEQLKVFFKNMEAELLKSKSSDSTIILQRSFMSEKKPFIFPKGSGEKYRHVMMMLSHIRAIAKDGISTFIQSISLPPQWDSSCDYALITGTIQFGFSQVRTDKIYGAIIHSSPEYLDYAMSQSLYQFGDYLKQSQAGNKRLLNIIVSNRPIPRHIKFWAAGIRHIELKMPETNAQPTPQQIKQQQMLQIQKQQNAAIANTHLPKTDPNKATPKQQQLSQQFVPNKVNPAPPPKMQAPISAIPMKPPSQPTKVSQPKLHTFSQPQTNPVHGTPQQGQTKSEQSIFGFSKELNELFLANPLPSSQTQIETNQSIAPIKSQIPPQNQITTQNKNFQQNQQPEIPQTNTQPIQYKNQNVEHPQPKTKRPRKTQHPQPQQSLSQSQQSLSQSQFGFPQPTKNSQNAIPSTFQQNQQPQSSSFSYTTSQQQQPPQPNQIPNKPPSTPQNQNQNSLLVMQQSPTPGINQPPQGFGPMVYRSQSQQRPPSQMQYQSIPQDQQQQQQQYNWQQKELQQQKPQKKVKKQTKKQTAKQPQQPPIQSQSAIQQQPAIPQPIQSQPSMPQTPIQQQPQIQPQPPIQQKTPIQPQVPLTTPPIQQQQQPPQISSDSMFASVNLQQTAPSQSIYPITMNYSLPQNTPPQMVPNQIQKPPLEQIKPEPQPIPQMPSQPPNILQVPNTMAIPQPATPPTKQMLQQQPQTKRPSHSKSQAKQLQKLQQQMFNMQQQQHQINPANMQQQQQQLIPSRQTSQQQIPTPMAFQPQPIPQQGQPIQQIPQQGQPIQQIPQQGQPIQQIPQQGQPIQQPPQGLPPQQIQMMYYQMHYYQQPQMNPANQQIPQQPQQIPQQTQQIPQQPIQQPQQMPPIPRTSSIPMPNINQSALMQSQSSEQFQKQPVPPQKQANGKNAKNTKKSTKKEQGPKEGQPPKEKKQKKTQKLQPKRFGFTDTKLPKKLIFLP